MLRDQSREKAQTKSQVQLEIARIHSLILLFEAKNHVNFNESHETKPTKKLHNRLTIGILENVLNTIRPTNELCRVQI